MLHAEVVKNNAHIELIPGAVTIRELRTTIENAGGAAANAANAVVAPNQFVDREAEAHRRELLRENDRDLWIALAFTIPLFLLSMVSDLFHDALMEQNILPWLFQTPLLGWIMFALAAPVYFYVGRAYHRGAWVAIRNRAPNMDLLISLGTSAAFVQRADSARAAVECRSRRAPLF